MMKRLLMFWALCLWCVGTSVLWAETHTVKYYINNYNFFTETLSEGDSLHLPVDDPSIDDVMVLVGWLPDAPLTSMQDTKPVGMIPADTVVFMGNTDLVYHAVFAEEVSFKFNARMITEDIPERDWSDAVNAYYVTNDYGTALWKFKGYKNNANGEDKFAIGQAVNTTENDSYISFSTPYPIQKVTVGVFEWGTATSKKVYQGFLYLRSAPGVTDSQVISKPSTWPKNSSGTTSSLGDIIPTFSAETYYLQASATARIYGIKLTCGYTNYRTTLVSDTIVIGESGFSTVCLPWHADIPAGLKAYRLDRIDLTKQYGLLKFEEVSAITEKKGYVVQGTPGQQYIFFRIYTRPEDADLTNEMYGVTARTDWHTLISEPLAPFVLSKGGCFVRYTGTNIPAKKAFVAVNPDDIQYDSKGAALFRMSFDGSDEEVSNLTECIEEFDTTPVIYNLSGKQESQLKPGGLYIVNGKKMLVK